MQAEIQTMVDVINKASASALEVGKALADINRRAADKIIQQQLNLVEQALKGGARQLTLLQETKRYKEYFAAQAELAKEGTEHMLAAARETLDAFTSARDALNALLEKGVSETLRGAGEVTRPAKHPAAKKAPPEAA